MLGNLPILPPNGDVCFINALPPELLSRIFEVGFADEEADVETQEVLEDEDQTVDEEDSIAAGIAGFPTYPFPIAVSLVCSHWRDVALSTPSLWTTLVITSAAHPPYEHVPTLLKLSKSLPIDIYVDCHKVEGGDSEEPSSDAVNFLFSLLTPHIHRWRTMQVSSSDFYSMYCFLNAVSDPCITAAPKLEALQLYCIDEVDSYELTLFGGFAPFLTRLALWGVHINWNQPWIASASQLTDLQLAFHREDIRPTWAQFATILRSSSTLKKLYLRESGPSGVPAEWFIEPTPGGPVDSPIQLPRVTDFVLAFHPPAHAIGLLRKLYLPALKKLYLHFERGDYTDFIRELAGPATSLSGEDDQATSLLSRLNSLHIAGLPCHSISVRKLYGELQNLTSLTLSLPWSLSTIYLDILCTSCTLSGRGDVWLPLLTTLYVSGVSTITLRVVVQKRRDAGVPLRSLYVHKCRLNDEDVTWLKENVETFRFWRGPEFEMKFIDQ